MTIIDTKIESHVVESLPHAYAMTDMHTMTDRILTI